MKTKLHNTLLVLVFAIVLMGAQLISAQQYLGLPYGGTALKIGETVGVGVKLQLENFDSVASNVDGAPIYAAGTAPTGEVKPLNNPGGTYYDAASGNSGNGGSPTYRTGSDVDISDITYPDSSVGRVLSDNQGQETLMFTVNVVTSGSYTAKINYSHNGGTKKNYQMYLHNPSDLTTATIIINANADNPQLLKTYNTGEPEVYADSAPTTSFNLTAGTWVFRSRVLSATWNLDYITFTLNTALSTSDVKLKENSLKAYPNPASNGQFKLTIDSEDNKWDVYSVLGTKVSHGSGENVDLSSLAKGTYILKTAKESTMLIYK